MKSDELVYVPDIGVVIVVRLSLLRNLEISRIIFLHSNWKLFVTSPIGAEPLFAPGSMRWPIGQREPGVIGCQPGSRAGAVNIFGD